MVARLALKDPDNIVSSSTQTHISDLDFNSHQESGGSHNANGTERGCNTSGQVEDQKQIPVVELTRKPNNLEMSGDNQA